MFTSYQMRSYETIGEGKVEEEKGPRRLWRTFSNQIKEKAVVIL